jgi:hypothetical protein
MDQLINSRVKIIEELISFIEEDIIPLNILADNDEIIVSESILHLKTLFKSIDVKFKGDKSKSTIKTSQSSSSIFQLTETIILSSIVADIIKKILNTNSITTMIVNIHEKDRKLLLHVNNIIGKLTHNDLAISNIVVDKIYTQYFNESLADMVVEFKKYHYLWNIYSAVISKFFDSTKTANIGTTIIDDENIIDKTTASKSNQITQMKKLQELIDINEGIKDYIIGGDQIVKWSEGDLNPFIKSFGLVPITNIISLDTLAILAFGKTVKNLTGLETLCKQKKTDLIVIKKILDRGIKYDILNLLDYKISKDYRITNDDNDGITQKTIDRFDNINYISKSTGNFSVKYSIKKLASETARDKKSNKIDVNPVLIIEELATGVYHILSTNLDGLAMNKYITEKTDIPNGFIEFISTGKHTTRINAYNDLINKRIVRNIFLGMHFNIKEKSEQITKKSYDPKYLKDKIYRAIMDEYRRISSKQIKNIYSFSKIAHDKKFNKIFSDVILEKYYSYLNTGQILKRLESQNIPKTEIYTSFMFRLNKYEKDFIKKMHDGLIKEIIIIQKNNVFEQSDSQKQLELIFDRLVFSVLTDVINIDSNLFESLDYKLYLTKLSLID